MLTGVSSRSHLIYASSYLRHVLATRPGEVHLTVLPNGDGLGDEATRGATVRDLLVADPRLVVEHATPDDTSQTFTATTELLCVGAPSVRAWTSYVRSQRGRRPRVVVIDEGLGSYGTWSTRRAAYRREGGQEPRSTVRAWAVATSARWLTSQRWLLYGRGPGGWQVADRVADEFRRRLSGPPGRPDVLVYLTQPWVALGVMTQQAYAAHLTAVSRAASEVGLTLAVRPHPWERRESYAEFRVVAGDAPAEIDRQVAEAAVVIGGNSTALLNLSAVHGARAVRVTTPELAPLDAALGDRQRSLLDAFLPRPVTVADLPSALRRTSRAAPPQ